MIAWLCGNIIDKQHPGKLVLNVQGVGYEVETSLNTFFKMETQQSPAQLHIHTIVREDALLLYGFLEQQERALFRALIKVNGIGPKLAMVILSSTSPDEFIRSIQQKHTSFLTQIPGIGKKTAERLMIEMGDLIKNINTPASSTEKLSTATPHHEAISALESLGYKAHEATKIVSKIDDGVKSSEQLIREALQLLTQVRS